jgi:benzoyl-CoA reductase/2-hydroxyglutaryl-CoA dehydratase subunit BcrC/BadD/HgdB
MIDSIRIHRFKIQYYLKTVQLKIPIKTIDFIVMLDMSVDGIISQIDSEIHELQKHLNNYSGRTVVYFTADIPIEVLTAAGLVPFRIPTEIPNENQTINIESIVQPFNCTKSRLFLEYILNNHNTIGGAIFSENYCDSLQNLADIVHLNSSLPDSLQYFRFLLPVNRGKKIEAEYFAKEIKRLIQWLEEWTGNTITYLDLIESIELHNTKRRLLAKLEKFIPPDNNDQRLLMSEYLKIKVGVDILPVEKGIILLQEVIQSLSKDNTADSPNEGPPRILVSGSMFDNSEVFEKIPKLNQAVVANDLSFGSRSNTFDISLYGLEVDQDIDQLLLRMAEAYIMQRIPDSVHFPTDRRRAYLLEMIEKFSIQGLIFVYYGFCDPDTFESRSLSNFVEEKIGLPTMTLQTDPHLSNLGQLTTRVEAFLERIGD